MYPTLLSTQVFPGTFFFFLLSNLHKGRIIKELLNVKNNFFLKTLKNVQVTTTNKIMKYVIRR